MRQSWKNFGKELACPCCGELRMNEAFMDRIQSARDMAGIKFFVSRGGACRCGKYQEELYREGRTGRLTSRHNIEFAPNGASALDVVAPDPPSRGRIIRSCQSVGLVSFCIYLSRRFIHIDDAPDPWIEVIP